MKIDISYTSIRHYSWKNIHYWAFWGKTYKNVRGFIVRILGIYINVRENNATEKLIKLGKNHE